MPSADHQEEARRWFISDLHYGHQNVLRHCNRPFRDMEDQTNVLIDDWNTLVGPQDIVYVLGDFSFYTPAETTNILQALKGQKILIRGNHDHSKDLAKTRGWMRVVDKLELRLGENKQRVVLDHNPILSWHQMHRGSIHLHGHCHGFLDYPEKLKRARILDVGVDNLQKFQGHWGPISYESVLDLMSARVSTSVDSHQVREPETADEHPHY